MESRRTGLRFSQKLAEAVEVFKTGALERDQAVELLARQALEAKLLHRAAEMAADADSVEAALQNSVGMLCEMTGWPVGHVYATARDDSQKLVSTTIWYLDDGDAFSVFREVTERTNFRAGEGLPGRILTSGKPAWIPNVQLDPNFPRNKLAKNLGVKGAFGFPVKISGQTVAVLEFFSDQEMAPDENLLEIMRNVGEQLGRVFERKRSEENLEKARETSAAAEATLRQAIESISEGFVLYDSDQRLILCNSKYRDFYAYGKDDVAPGTRFEDLVRLDLQRGTIVDDGAHETERTAYRYRPQGTFEIQLSDGRWLLAREHTTDTGTVSIQTEITDLKRVERELATQRNILETALQAINQGIVMVDGDMRTVACNKRFLLMFDLPEAMMQEQPDFEKVVREILRGAGISEEARRDTFTSIHSREPLEYERVQPNGRVIEVHHYPVDAAGFVRTYTDVTQRKQAEVDVEQARDKAQEASRAKGQFLANMSHEIRTPMNAIVGMTNLALRTELTPQQRDYLLKVRDASGALLQLINDLLDFSKIEAGKLNMESVPFRLDEVLDNVGHVVGLKAAEKGLEFLFSTARGVPAELVGDPLRLRQVLINLAGNAVKFTERGEVVISVERTDARDDRARLRFVVRDTGIGLTQDQKTGLFEAFAQADESTTRKYGGTGLGLAICKQLVEMMGGEIAVESAFGAGSTFSFSAEFGMQPCAADRPMDIPAHLLGMRVLVVDDNESARQIMCEMLTSLKFRVTAVASGEEALEELQRGDGDLSETDYAAVFMDWKLDGMDGVDATWRIKSAANLAYPPKVIMVTAYDRDELADAARGVSVDGFLTKPLSQSAMFNAVVDLLGPRMESEAARAVTREVTATPDLRGVRVLIVEDNEVNQQVAFEVLRSAGVEAEIAGNGVEALEALAGPEAAARFDAVLMDLQMPEMDGIEATRRLRANPWTEALPIVAMTAHAMPEEREQCFEAGMNDHIAKPIDPEALFSTLARWMPRTASPRSVATESQTLLGEAAEVEESTSPEHLPGLNIAQGAQRLGGRESVYRQILRAFLRSHADTGERIREAIDEGDLALVSRLAHAVKGAAGNISAMRVFECGAVLEAAGKRGDRHAVSDAVGPFVDALAELVVSLRRLDRRPDSDAEVAPRSEEPVDVAALAGAVDELFALLGDHNMRAGECFDVLRARFDLSPCEEAVDRLQGRIAALDFDAAKEWLRQIADYFDIAPEGS